MGFVPSLIVISKLGLYIVNKYIWLYRSGTSNYQLQNFILNMYETCIIQLDVIVIIGFCLRIIHDIKSLDQLEFKGLMKLDFGHDIFNGNHTFSPFRWQPLPLN